MISCMHAIDMLRLTLDYPSFITDFVSVSFPSSSTKRTRSPSLKSKVSLTVFGIVIWNLLPTFEFPRTLLFFLLKANLLLIISKP